VITVAGVRRLAGTRGPADAGGFEYGDNYSEEGQATSAQLRAPSAVAFGPDGDLYILDQGNSRVLKVEDPGPSTQPGKISRVAGAYTGPSGAPSSTQLMRPRGVAFGPDGSVYVADADKSVIRRVRPDGGFHDIVAGIGRRGGAAEQVDGALAVRTPLAWPSGIAVTPDGTLYIADRGTHRILKVTNPGASGVLTVVAGTGLSDFQSSQGVSTEGRPATKESLNSPSDLAVGHDGTLYISDTHNSKIRKVTADGRIFTLAGTGTYGWNGDSSNAQAAEISQPAGLAVGPDNTVYFMDAGNACARKITPGGALVTVAGTCGGSTGAAGSGLPLGDGGRATSASFGTANAQLAPAASGGPEGIALGADGSLYIADTYNCRLRKVTPEGMISTIAGTDTCGEGGDGGPARTAQLWGPRGLAVDRNGVLVVGDTDANRVRLIGPGA
jgi:sugar lactone lactonase YvrE